MHWIIHQLPWNLIDGCLDGFVIHKKMGGNHRLFHRTGAMGVIDECYGLVAFTIGENAH